MFSLRHVLPAVTTSAMLLMAGCGGNDTPRTPSSPTPPPAPPPTQAPVTANAYILPDAISKGDWAFGDKPIVINKGERLRWVNADTLTHVIVADSPDATDFRKTDDLHMGGEQSFIMNKLGTTSIHCSIHPAMTGTLIVREH
jgi:plastocyanin